MSFYRRRLPHWIPNQAVLFLTWRLAGSVPLPAVDLPTRGGAGRALPTRDERRERVRVGPLWLQDPRVARVVTEALHYGETVRQFYTLHAWVVMPNHVHVILEPATVLPDIMRWLKGRTSRSANRILGRTGEHFWQDESWDHWVRSREELQDLITYVENNPVRAGLVKSKEEWPWTSARDAADKRG